MEDEKAGCVWFVLIFTAIAGTCFFLWQFSPEREPLLTVELGQVRPTATPDVFHTILLEEAKTDNQIEVMVVKHELRKDWAWVAAPWAAIILGSVCFVMAFRKWLKASS